MAMELSPEEMRSIAKEAFVYGWPICENYNTLYAYAIDVDGPAYKAPMNHLHSEARVFTPEDKVVVTPNSDTPYSFIWMDLRAEPVLLTVPKMEEDRYFSFQLIDMYTHNFAYLGTRCTGNQGGVYMVTGPNWTGGSDGAHVDQEYTCETPFALAIVRTQLKGPEDLERVKEIQHGYQAYTLSAFLGKLGHEASAITWPKSNKALTGTVKMFEILDFVLCLLPVHPSEQDLRTNFLKMGIGSGTFQVSEANQSALELGMKDAWAEYDEVIEQGIARGLVTSAELFGTRGFLKNQYIKRFGGAKVGLYGNSREEAFYPFYKMADGQPLDASKSSYQLVLSKEDQEIARAFWSLTMYDGITQLLVPNALQRYLFNSPMLPSMRQAEDGSVTLHVSAASPGPEKESNWLPAPDGPFYMVLRLYLPKAAAFEGWKQPKLVPVPK
mmetsp:Transcript_12508/g.29574  ORF Transcript_12508/g.29574 Transcript_12508/m.29574 type:complete len:440 (-) Transcript_12508:149-1468(-)